MKGRNKNKLTKAAMVVLWLCVWQIAAMLVDRTLLLPSPIETGRSLAVLMGTADFWKTVGATLARVGTGFVCGIAVGSTLGVLTALSAWADALFSPIRSLIKATPVTSFIVLVLLWLTKTVVPAFISFLMVLPVAWANVREAVLATDAELLEMARVYRLSRGKVIKHIYVPSAMPGFVAACSTGLGFAWKSGVAAEVIARPAFSIGKSIQESHVYLEIPELFAWTVAVILVSVGIEKLMLSLLGRVRT